MASVLSRLGDLVPSKLLVAGIARAHRRFEPELGTLDDLLPVRRRTALDIGAWYGPWTIALARRFDRVITFEPNPVVADRLSRALPANVELHRVAASDHAGMARLHAPGRLGAEGVGSLRSTSDSDSVFEVEACPVDDLAPTEVDFVKIDVEGHELEALRGMARILGRDRPVLVVELEERLAPIAPVLDLLTTHGYEAHRLRHGHLERFDPLTAPPTTALERGYVGSVLRPDPERVSNVVFLPAEGVAEERDPQ